METTETSILNYVVGGLFVLALVIGGFLMVAGSLTPPPPIPDRIAEASQVPSS